MLSDERLREIKDSLQWLYRMNKAKHVSISDIDDMQDGVDDLLAEIERLQAELERARGTWVPVDEWRKKHEDNTWYFGAEMLVLCHDGRVRLAAYFKGVDDWRINIFGEYINPLALYVLDWQPPAPPESEVNDAER